ncbi:hypothetical protein [Glycomyces sp. YM15]|uniref:hypothetical protein n=1 Tax=Glycomyces sp. YM15 TaxID=2800446 RepID=UPI00196461CF|nr:hypothetical protein [Glycomyces sp. YM15]
MRRKRFAFTRGLSGRAVRNDFDRAAADRAERHSSIVNAGPASERLRRYRTYSNSSFVSSRPMTRLR